MQDAAMAVDEDAALQQALLLSTQGDATCLQRLIIDQGLGTGGTRRFWILSCWLGWKWGPLILKLDVKRIPNIP